MPRILGVDLPEQKKVSYALQSLYGVGKKVSQQVVEQAHVEGDKRASELTKDEVNRIQRVLEQFDLEGDLRRIINDNIDRLKRVRSYRGMRHIAKLPSRGQRTRTNSRSARGGGKRRTVGAMTKEMAAKLDEAKKGK